ncbi:YihY/virulence factor BrkB family protein [Stagnihabitans tardus]|uniref:YihY family inner membrane protein n=1 Tax=Stagnihabitans tardus TaxID=2699202 RepID=A0AAE5BTM1_9RHOB|nr:YihY family inner membrane protein [Stagnihabitans tardus]
MLSRFLPPRVIAAGWNLYRRVEQAELSLISAGVAFFGFLALFPATAVIIAIWGAWYDPAIIEKQIDVLRPVLPPEALSLIHVQVRALVSVSGAPLGWATAISTLFALWSARAGVDALIRGLNAIHRLPNRTTGHHHLRALVLTLALMGLALAAMLATVVAPLVIAVLPLPGDDAVLLHRANLALGVFLVLISISLAYRFGPNHRVKPRLFTTGLWVAVGLWALAARLFMLYLANFPSYNKVYGTIGAVVILLMWLYASAFSVLLGAAVDAERRRQ